MIENDKNSFIDFLQSYANGELSCNGLGTERLKLFIALFHVKDDHLSWRGDLRCGAGFPVNGVASECDPEGEFPCCSNVEDGGWCGNTEKHCLCETCLDYAKLAAELMEKRGVILRQFYLIFVGKKCAFTCRAKMDAVIVHSYNLCITQLRQA